MENLNIDNHPDDLLGKSAEPKPFLTRLKLGVRKVWQRLDLLYWLEVGLDKFGRFVQSYEGSTLIFFGLIAGISVYGIISNSARLVSGMGLLWLFLFIGLFFLLSFTKEGILVAQQFLTESKDDLDGSGAIIVQKILSFIVLVAERLLNTLSSLLVTFAYLIGQLHLKSAAGELDHLFTISQWSWMDWALFVVLPCIGFASDVWNYFRELYSKNSVITVAGIAQFYFLGAMLITGLIGGKPPLEAALWIFEHPFLWVFSEVPNVEYEASRAFTIISGTGGITFVYLYLLMPLFFYGHAKEELRKAAEQLPTLYRPSAAKGLIGFSSIFLLVFLYVSWQQGWIMQAFEFLVFAFLWLVQQIGRFLEWLVSLLG